MESNQRGTRGQESSHGPSPLGGLHILTYFTAQKSPELVGNYITYTVPPFPLPLLGQA